MSAEPGTFELRQCLEDAWRTTWAHLPLILGVTLVGVLLGVLVSLTGVGLVAVVPVLFFGYARFTLNLYDGRASFSDLFAGFSVYSRAWSQMLVLFLLLVGIGLVGESVSFAARVLGSSALHAVGSLVNLAWALGVSARLSFAWYYSVDQDMSALDALRVSWRSTSRQRSNVVFLMLLAGLVGMMGAFVIVVGLLVSIPMSMLLWPSAYRQLTGTTRAPEPKPV